MVNHLCVYELLERFGIVTPEAYAESTGGSIEASAKALARLAKKGLLSRHKLMGVTPYYAFPEAEPMKAASLQVAYCLLIDSVFRKASLLSPLEAQGGYPWLPKGAYAVDDEGVLAAIRVDAAYSAQYVSRKCRQWLSKVGTRPEFQFEAQRGRIVLRVLTTTTAKARQVQTRLRSPIPTQIVVIPKFAQLIGGNRHE